jgi:hypothetical protein
MASHKISSLTLESASEIMYVDCDYTPRKYPYFDVVVGLVWSHDPKSYAGGSVCYW